MNKFYTEIDKALRSYEQFKPYHNKSVEWICDRITWCWKWKKITEEQKNELADRITYILKNNLC